MIRHEVHGGPGVPSNALRDEARLLAKETGHRLAQTGVRFDCAYTSPQGRAVETLHCVMVGMGRVLPMRTDDRFGDARLGKYALSDEQIAVLKADAEATGRDGEDLLLESPLFSELILARGREGAQALREYAAGLEDRCVAICSHSGSRLEAMVAVTMGRLPKDRPFTFERGGVARLVVDSETFLVCDIAYL